MEQIINELLEVAVDRLFNKVFQSQDLVGYIYEIIIKLNDREFTFYGVSEYQVEKNTKDFLKEIILDKELFETYVN